MNIPTYIKNVMEQFDNCFINHNNELILIPKYNVYFSLNSIESEADIKVALCEWFSRSCCCANVYRQEKRQEKYWKDNTDKFNKICGTDFTVEQMCIIYTYLGNGIRHNIACEFVKSNMDLNALLNQIDSNKQEHE